jgi:hypothetical protein
MNSCIFSFQYHHTMNMVIKIDIAFFAANYNNSLIVIHPALHRHYDATISTCPVRRQPCPPASPALPSSSIIFAFI